MTNGKTLCQFLFHSSSLLEQTIFDDAENGAKAVFPADFLAFLVGASGVADPHFIDAEIFPSDAGGHFRLKAEAVLLKGGQYFLKALASEEFIACLHVGEVQVGEAVRQGREKPVSDGVPIVQDAVLAVSEETAAVHDIGPALNDRLQELRVFVGVVFQVGVLYDHDVAGCLSEAGAQCRALALVHVVELQRDAVERIRLVRLRQRFHDFPGIVMAAVVYQDDLLSNGHFRYGLQKNRQGLLFVVDGDDHGENEIIRNHEKPERFAYRLSQQFAGFAVAG